MLVTNGLTKLSVSRKGCLNLHFPVTVLKGIYLQITLGELTRTLFCLHGGLRIGIS